MVSSKGLCCSADSPALLSRNWNCARSAARQHAGWLGDEAAARLTQRAFGARPILGAGFEPLRITSARSRPLRLGLGRIDLQLECSWRRLRAPPPSAVGVAWGAAPVATMTAVRPGP